MAASPLPLSFVLLPTSLSSPRLTPFLTATLNGVTIYRTLDPEPGEPFVSSSLLLLSQGMSPMAALTRFGCRLPLGYDTTLSGLSPFPEIWVPLKTAREMAINLGVMDQLSWLLSWRTRAMASWLVEGGQGGEVVGGVVGHNWRLPEDRADPSAYSHQTLLSTPITSNIVMLPEDQTILTLLSPSHLSSLLTADPPASIPPSPYSYLWHPLVTLTAEAFESQLVSMDSSTDVEPTSSAVLASLIVAILDGSSTPAFPPVDKDELVRLLGGRRGPGEEGRKVLVKGAELLGGLVVAAILGGQSRAIQREPSEMDGDQSMQAAGDLIQDESGRTKNGRLEKRSTRPRPLSPSPPPSPVRVPSPVPATAPPQPPLPVPPQLTSHLDGISAQISDLSQQVAALASRPPEPAQTPSVAPAPSPRDAHSPTSSLSKVLFLPVLLALIVSNLYHYLHAPTPTLAPAPAQTPDALRPEDIQSNRAYVLQAASDYRTYGEDAELVEAVRPYEDACGFEMDDDRVERSDERLGFREGSARDRQEHAGVRVKREDTRDDQRAEREGVRRDRQGREGCKSVTGLGGERRRAGETSDTTGEQEQSDGARTVEKERERTSGVTVGKG